MIMFFIGNLNDMPKWLWNKTPLHMRNYKDYKCICTNHGYDVSLSLIYLKFSLFCGMRSICFIYCGSIFVFKIALIMSSLHITVFFWRTFSSSRSNSLFATNFHLFYFETTFDFFLLITTHLLLFFIIGIIMILHLIWCN